MKAKPKKPLPQIGMVQMAIANEPMVNADAFLEKARKAVAGGAKIVVGPEMMLGPYVCGDLFEVAAYIMEMQRAMEHIVAESKNINAVLIFGGVGLATDGSLGEDGRMRKYNAAFVVQNGALVHNCAGLPFAIKALLPNYRIFDDARHFFPLPKLASERGVPAETLLQPFPVEIDGVTYRLGVMLCEDMWDDDYAFKPSRVLKANGADVLINISCSPWSWRKNAKRDRVIKSICKNTGLWFVYVNNVGCQNNGKNFITFDGSSTIYNPKGGIIAMVDAYKAETMVVKLLAKSPVLKRAEAIDVAQLYKAIEVATHGFLDTLPSTSKNKVVIGVSGGIDSALSVAFFARLMGPNNVIAVNMPYKDYNTDETKDDAAELCRRLKVHYRVEPIDVIVDETCRLAGIVPGTSQHKTAQAVARMTVLSAIASQVGGFFTCNANWTELAFGYGTLHGDMRGHFAPWMNCTKQDVYRLSDYLNRVVYRGEVIPQSIIDRPPMDELVPIGFGDRKDPFDFGTIHENGYHDQLVRALVAFRLSAEDILKHYLAGTLEHELHLPERKVDRLFPNEKLFLEDLERCFALFHNAIFKRVQSVPGPLVDKRSFGWDLRESVLPQIQTTLYKSRVAFMKRIGCSFGEPSSKQVA
jgi:NAD+ synthase (glutamine-hydrolysing)